MLQLTYISTAMRGLPETAVGEILSASRRNNAAASVTGLLLYNGQRFLQALEGPADLVHRTYERIKLDPRHKAVVLLSSNEVETRAFGNWSMASERVAAMAGAGGIAESVDVLTDHVADPSMKALFRSFARVRDAA